MSRRSGGHRGFDDRSAGGLPDAPRRQMPPGPSATAMRSDRGSRTRPSNAGNTSNGGNGGTQSPFARERGPNTEPAPPPDAWSQQVALYEEREPVDAQREERQREQSRRGPSAMSIAAHASDNKPLQVYPFGVSRNRLEQAVKELRVPVSIVKDMNDADIVMTLKNYYRKSSQALRSAEQSGVPVFVLKSNTLVQIESALSNVFNVEIPDDPVTVAMEEAEDAITTVLDTAKTIDLAPQLAHVRKLQHQMAERYNLGSVSRGKEPFRRVRIFRQD